MAHDPVHLFIGLYDSVEGAEHDFDNVISLHRQGLVGAYDAAVIERVRGEIQSFCKAFPVPGIG